MASRLLRVDSARFRVRDWQDSTDVAHVAPMTTAATLTPVALVELRNQLQDFGYQSVVTAAVATCERNRLMMDGFRVHSELVALSRELTGAAGATDPSLRDRRTQRARAGDLSGVLRVDATAFAPFWRIDAEGLREALTAARSSRYRVVRASEVLGYCVTGRAGTYGYLQRLAVAAAEQGQGHGAVLIADALRWLRHRRVRTVLVNTTPDNQRALALYFRYGFKVCPDKLAILHRTLQ